MVMAPRGRTARVAVLSLCVLAVVGLVGAVVGAAWQSGAQRAEVVDKELAGADMLPALTTLLVEMTDAEFAAVRGTTVDKAALTAALDGVAAAEEPHSATLRIGQRIADLRTQTEAALASGHKGEAAYETYSGLVTLVAALISAVGDASGLILDPALDSYYVIDSVLLRLPQAIIQSGRAVDIASLAPDSSTGEDDDSEDEIRVAVARFDIATISDAVSTGLSKSVAATTRAQFGATISRGLDAFRAAADTFAPPVLLSDLSGTVDLPVLTATAQKVSATALTLSQVLVEELRGLLTARRDEVSSDQRFITITTTIAAAFGVLLLWVLTVNRSRERTDLDENARPEPEEAALASLTSARDLLAAEELVHVGRAVRQRPREDADAD